MRLLLCLLACTSLAAQDVCHVFGRPPAHSIVHRTVDEWKYVYAVVHVHDSIPATVVYEAITDANQQLSDSHIQLSLVAVEYHEWNVPDTVCFPYSYVPMEEYVIPIQYPTTEYMNIHVMPEFCGNTLGFAFLWYAVNQDADGVYVRSDCFGTTGNLLPDRNENKTLVHELGHYFSLFHTFQGIDYCGEEEADCTLVNDRVCDTPPVKLNWSCSDPICPAELYDYTPNNYMDYYVDSCKTQFTQGQIERMHSVMPLWRPQIVRDTPFCEGDLNNDLNVDILDLLVMFTCYGTDENTQADINKDGIVSVADLTTLLMHWSIAC